MPPKRISVKAKPDRVVRTSPTGDFIPSDRFVPVNHTAYIDRLINFHRDLVVEPAAEAPAKAKPAPEVPSWNEEAKTKKETK